MRVLSAISTTEIGGAERYLELLAEELEKLDAQMRFVGAWPSTRSDERTTKINIGPKWSKRTLARSIAKIRKERQRYLQEIRRSPTDVVHMQFKREQIALTRAVSKTAPVIWTEHGVWPSGLYGLFLGWLYKRAARHVDRIICVSEPVARSLTERVGIPPSLLEVIDNPVDTRTYHPRPRSEPPRRAELGIASDAVVLMTTSRLEHAKGIDRVIEAMQLLPDNFHLVVVGEGSSRQTLEQLAASAPGKITFTGFRSDVAELLRDADIFVLPSRAEAREGSPLSVLQAMATGLPLIMSDDCGVVTIVEGAGVVRFNGTSSGLADAALKAARESTRLSASSISLVPRFSIEAWTRSHADVMRSVAYGTTPVKDAP